MQAKDLRNALETALHALVSTDGLVVTDRPDLLPEAFVKDCTWRVDNKEAASTVRRAIRELTDEAAENNAVWQDREFVFSATSSPILGGMLRRFHWITKDDETKGAWLDLVMKKGLSRRDLILLIGAMGINYEQFSAVVPDCHAEFPENLPEVSELLAHC